MPKKSFAKKNTENTTHKMIEKDPDAEEYGIVTKKLGSGKFMIKLNGQDKEVIGRLCGKMKQGKNKHSNWVDIDSVVLVGLRDFQDNMVDINHVYDNSEIRKLKKSGKLVEDVPEKNEDELDNADGFDFDEL